MAGPTLSELSAVAAGATDPGIASARLPKPGGVDPLGLRQINFDLLDLVFPDVNNVARHIRPFVLIAWAWRRAGQLAEKTGGTDVKVENLRDFVARMEVLFVWSQFLRNPAVDLPGGQFLEPLIRGDGYVFGGPAWATMREARRMSTALSAPINYGPASRSLGWVQPHPERADVMIASPVVAAALDAFEVGIAPFLDHPAFSEFDSVEVSAAEVRLWAEGWALDRPSEAERSAAAESLQGQTSSPQRRAGVKLMLDVIGQSASTDVASLRRSMCGRPTNFAPAEDVGATLEAWRKVQVRQAFRLALEGLLFWVTTQLSGAPRSTGSLVDAFLTAAPDRSGAPAARQWIGPDETWGVGPTDVMDAIERAFRNPGQEGLPTAIVEALRFCLVEAPEAGETFERRDRLPLFRARSECEAWGDRMPAEFMKHILESWVLAQHVYWSIGRGLADARASGNTILRLKVTLEEGGWTLTPGATAGGSPNPTPDRLRTILSLATESGLVDETKAA